MARPIPGFSLVELMISIAVMAILMALAVPSFSDFFDKARVRGAADRVVSLISTARGEAVKNGRNVTISMRGPTSNWCIGANEAPTPAVAAQFATSSPCDCRSGSACFVDGVRRVVESTEFSGVTASAATMSFVVDGKLGNLEPLAASSVDLISPAGAYQARLTVSPLGQTRACVPAGQKSISGFPSC